MKTKFLYIAALALLVSFTACENETPFDTQTPDDAPLILRPYNESGTGSFTYRLANPETPLLDSVTVTPSKYTTVKWYLNGQLVHTGTRIEMCFLAGKYDLLIEATTEAGKRTERTGSVTVNPFSYDPSSSAPAAGRHFVPGQPSSIDGANLTKVTAIDITADLYGVQVLKTITPASATDSHLEFIMPEMADGAYFLRLKDANGKRYGADMINVHNASVALSGYAEFVPGKEWVITGVDLANVASVKVDDITITELVTTETTVTLTAPDAAVGEHRLSMKNQDGSDVLFITAEGAVKEVTTIVSAEITIWEGYCVLDWGNSNVKLTAEQLAPAAGKTILVYYEFPEATYHNLRITTDWWGGNLVDQIDVTAGTPNPFTFVYDERCQGLVASEGKAALIVGFGETITKVTYK